MSHAHPARHDLSCQPDAARSFVREPAALAVPEQLPHTRLLAAFARAVTRAVRADPASHEQWRRHRHDHGCQCGSCARWQHVGRHGPRGRQGGGGI